ncbi:spondin domain-containing protein [Oligoflexia bacterium]|nr:spondin domain-containing protein [Oligoflexia bacterium]
MKNIKSIIGVVLVLCLVPSMGVSATYKINFKNRTSQTLTQAVCAVHSKKASIFTIGSPASSGLAELAQDGVASQFRSEVTAMTGVKATAVGDFISPGSKSTTSITALRGKRISCVIGMLVATNDAFPAFQGVRLPKRVGQRVRFRARTYDAGSEVNSESCDHVPGGPCDAHFVGVAENGTVEEHGGLLGTGDLNPNQHGWSEPAVRGKITRVK